MRGVGCRPRQSAWRQAAEQTRQRPRGTKGSWHTGRSIVTPSLRNGWDGSIGRALFINVIATCSAAGLLHAERLAGGDHDDGMVEQATWERPDTSGWCVP